MTGRRTARLTAAGMLLAIACGAAGGLACGHYGPPVRAEEYREAQKKEEAAREQSRKESTPQSRNEPLPAAP
jgi:hypothetical protein